MVYNTNDEAISTLTRYLERELSSPKLPFSGDAFKKFANSRWVVLELMESFSDNPLEMPDVLVDNFILKLHWCKIDSEKSNLKFKEWGSIIEEAEKIREFFIY